MTGAELKTLLAQVTTDLEQSATELRELDAAIGDGDLGITVSVGSAAVRSALAEQDYEADEATVRDVMLTAARAFANANPSTFAALVASGLLRGAKAVGGDPVSLEDAVHIGRAVFDGISQRGKSNLGDKTVLDALGPSIDALEESARANSSTGEALQAAIEAARRGIEMTTTLVNQKGRAGWLGERTAGHPDPGATTYLRYLEAWQKSVERT